jgi:hypothetical protein
MEHFVQELQYSFYGTLFAGKSSEVWSQSLAHTLCRGIVTVEFYLHVPFSHLWGGLLQGKF